MRPHQPNPLFVAPLLLALGGCFGDSEPGTPALVLLDSLASLDNGLVTSPVYIGPDLVVGAGMSPLVATERHWVIRRDGEGRWAVTDEYEHRPAGVQFGLTPDGGRTPGASGPPNERGTAGGSLEDRDPRDGEPAGAMLAILDSWGTVRPRLALVGGYWEPIDEATRFEALAGNPTGRRFFQAEGGDSRQWSLLSADATSDHGAVTARRVVSGALASFGASSGEAASAWGLMSDQPAADVAQSRPRVTGILAPAGLPLTPAGLVTREEALGRNLLDSLPALVEGWSGAAPFRTAGMHRLTGPGGQEWVFVRASRPGARTCETEVLEGWVQADHPDRIHQMVRGTTECGGPGWPTSRPLGALESGGRHFAISMEGEGPAARIGITELFESSVGSRRGGAAELAGGHAEAAMIGDAGEPGEAGAGPEEAWKDWPIVLSYIQPSALDGVPDEVRAELDREGCLIPTLQWGHQNVVRGRFAAPTQQDWAVLCSRDGVSEIRVFWGGPARCPQPIAPSPDRQWLQDRGDSTAVLGRTVGRYTPDEVGGWLAYYDLDPGIHFTHDVLLDTREGKPVNGFRYCSGGVWITEG